MCSYRTISKVVVLRKAVEILVTTTFSGLMNNRLSNRRIWPLVHSILLLLANNRIIQSEVKVKDCIGESKRLDFICTDFKIAFYKVNHKLFLCKLNCYGIHGIFLKWIESYLYCRIQRVKPSNTLFSDFIAYFLVPRGSRLGPLLFLIFVNDSASVFDDYIDVLLFADDTKKYTAVRYINLFFLLLRNNLNRSVECSVEWSSLLGRTREFSTVGLPHLPSGLSVGISSMYYK